MSVYQNCGSANIAGSKEYDAEVVAFGCGDSLYVKIDFGDDQKLVDAANEAHLKDWGWASENKYHVAGACGARIGDKVRVKRLLGSTYFDFEITILPLRGR
jgi:hypothetical protein